MFYIGFAVVFSTVVLCYLGTRNKVMGEELSAIITSQEDWQLGSSENIDYDLPEPSGGSIRIDAANGEKLNLSSDQLTVVSQEGDKDKIIDSDWNLFWNGDSDSYGSYFLTVDLGQIYQISQIKSKFTLEGNVVEYGQIDFYGSTNGLSYSGFDFGVEYVSSEVNTRDYSPSLGYRYIKLYSLENFDCDENPGTCSAKLYELEIYVEGGSATHTTAPTQIDGTADLTSWDSFEPDEINTANTTTEYQFRTSPDGSDWSSWTTAEEYDGVNPIDLSGLDVERYFQVKATLSTTDPADTPQINDYTINYTTSTLCENFDHLNISPSNITLDSGGTTNITATPVDAGGTSLPAISVSYSADCGSITPTGAYTAPTTATDTTCTITATSDCGGSATSTITVNGTDNPPPTCNYNGIQDNGETGTDCGGGACPDCVVPPEVSYHAELSPSLFTLSSSDSQKIAVIFKDQDGNVVSKKVVEDALGPLTPDFGSSFFSLTQGGGILSNENQDNLIIDFTAGGTVGNYSNSIVFSALNGALKAYSTPNVVDSNLSINVNIEQDSIFIQPDETFTFNATTFSNFGQDITKKASYSWSLSSSEAGSLSPSTTSSVNFTAGSFQQTYELTVSSSYKGAKDSDSTTIYIRKLDPNNQWRISSRPYFLTNTWVGQTTKFQFVPQIKINDSTWANRYGEDLKTELTYENVGDLEALSGNNYIFSLNPQKEGCYPFLVKGYIEKFGKTYQSYISYNVASNDQSSAYYKYQPGLGSSLLEHPNISQKKNTKLVLQRRDQLGNYYDWYDWLYQDYDLTTTWILNDARLGTLVPRHNTAFLNSSEAEPGYYPRALTTKVSFRGEEVVENWDIQVYSNDDYNSLSKTKFPDNVPTEIVASPNSLVGGISKGVVIEGFALPDQTLNYPYIVSDYNRQALELVNQGVNLIFKTKDEEGIYPNAITLSLNQSGEKEGITKSIDLRVTSDAEVDLCSGIVGPVRVAEDTEDDDKVIGNLDKDNWLASAMSKISDDLLEVLAKSLLALAALSALLSYLTPFANLIRGFWLAGKKNSIGVVYSATSGEPQQGKIVLLFDADSNRLLKSDITDADGQFNFSLPDGKYYMEIRDEDITIAKNLSYISKKSLFYSNNYFGEIFTISNNSSSNQRYGSEEQQIRYNIPTITKHEKEYRSLALLNLKNNLLKLLIYLDWPLLIFGTLFSILALIKTPDIINILILIAYFFLWARHSITRPIGRSFGVVIDEDTKKPVPLAIVRALDYKTKKLVQTSVTNRAGHFSLNLQKGYYLLTVQKFGYINLEPVSVEIKKEIKTANINLYLKAIDKLMQKDKPKIDKFKSYRRAKSLNDIIKGYSGEIGL